MTQKTVFTDFWQFRWVKQTEDWTEETVLLILCDDDEGKDGRKEKVHFQDSRSVTVAKRINVCLKQLKIRFKMIPILSNTIFTDMVA